MDTVVAVHRVVQQQGSDDPEQDSEPDSQGDWEIVLDPQEQVLLYEHAQTTLNIRGIPMAAYIQQYGPLSIQSPFGEFHWAGLLRQFMGYRWRHTLGDLEHLVVCWVLIPARFGRQDAALPPGPSDHQYYPAVVWMHSTGLARMACLHIAIMSSRPWWIHAERVFYPRAFMEVWRFYMAPARPRRYRLGNMTIPFTQVLAPTPMS